MTADRFIPAIVTKQLEQARRAIARDGYVRLMEPYAQKVANEIYNHLDSEIQWWRTLNQGEALWDLGPESIVELEGPKGAALSDAVHQGARQGFQFYFDNFRCPDDPSERKARGLLLDQVLDGLNSTPALELFRNLTGHQSIGKVDGQATRYLPGHFLMAHDDAVDGKNRIAAYVLNLTPEWETDWGGLLQFHDESGDVTHAMLPRFNALHIFTVPKLHSVSMVTPFAKAPRYAITGWLRRAD